MFCPPIPVKYKGKLIGGDPIDLLENSICQPLQEMLTNDEVREIETFFNITLPNGLGVKVIPIDFTKGSFDDKYLKGQAVVVQLTELFENLEFQNKNVDILKSSFVYDYDRNIKFTIKIEKQIGEGRNYKTEKRTFTFPLTSELLNTVKDKNNFLKLNSILISHNGIYADLLETERGLFGSSGDYGELGKGFVFGYISLYDKLRPNLTVSRDKLKDNISYELWSNLAFATKEILEYCKDKSQGIFGRGYFFVEEISVANLDNISLLNSGDGWERVFSFYVEGKYINFQELTEIVKTKPVNYGSYYIDYLSKSYLYQKYFDVELVIGNNSSDSVITFIRPKSAERRNLKYFPPLWFVPFKDNCELLYCSGYLNLSHPFCEWFVDSTEYLKTNYNALFQSLLNYLDILRCSYYSKNESRESILIKINELLGRIRKLSSFDELYKPSYEIDLDNKEEL